MTRTTVAFAAMAGYAAAQQGYGSETTTTYACNPAHQYPAGEVCTEISGSLTLVTPSATAPAAYATSSVTPPASYATSSATPPAAYSTSTAACPAPGSAGPDGSYSCNPAHEYPEGQTCVSRDGCYYLVNHSTTAPATYATSSATPPAAYSTSTAACPAPGTTGPDGSYSCNPAHEYPEGQTCVSRDGCYYLVNHSTPTAPAGYSSSTATAPATYSTSSAACPAAGTSGPDGSYSCNPAHQYPENQFCILKDGCYYLVNQGPGVTVTPSATAPASYPTSSCPASGTNSNGEYSCNPAHEYPAGQTCTLKDGCYYLVYSTAPAYTAHPTTTTSAVPTGGPSGIPLPETCNCYLKLGECQTGPNANQAYCASQFASCANYNPYTGDATAYFANLEKYCTPAPKYTTTVETAYTTYCPQPTTFTHGPSTYVITTATTVTLPCPGGCVVTKPVQPPVYTVPTLPSSPVQPPAYTKPTSPVQPPAYTKPSMPPVQPSQPPAYTKPSPPPASMPPASNPPASYTPSKPSGSVPPPAYTSPAPPPASYTPSKPSGSVPPPAYTSPAPPPAYTSPASPPAYTQPATSPAKPSGSVPPASYVPPAPSMSSATKPPGSTPSVPVTYTGAAGSLKAGVPAVAALALGALLL